MTETPLLFGSAGEELFGMFHEPPTRASTTGVVLCHPFGEEKLWAHRVFVAFAREMARRGVPVLRFDYRGNGDSAGDFAATSVSTAVADTQRAIALLEDRAGVSRVVLAGLRFGAIVASQVAELRDDVDALLLWAPIVDGSKYIQELLRINLSTQMAVYREIRFERPALVEEMRAGRTVNIDGYEMSIGMHDELSAVKLHSGPKRFAGRCLIVQIDRAPSARPSPALEALRAQYARATLVTAQEDSFWREIERFYDGAPDLFAKTFAWLEGA
ncbi:MAG: alpha/beta fold hydrolase [Vicinamibacterales bacterium]